MLLSPAVWAIVANNFAFHYAFYVVMNWLPTYFNRYGWGRAFFVGQVFCWFSVSRGEGGQGCCCVRLLDVAQGLKQQSNPHTQPDLQRRENGHCWLTLLLNLRLCAVPCCAVPSPAVCCGWIWRPWVPSRRCPTWLCLV